MGKLVGDTLMRLFDRERFEVVIWQQPFRGEIILQELNSQCEIFIFFILMDLHIQAVVLCSVGSGSHFTAGCGCSTKKSQDKPWGCQSALWWLLKSGATTVPSSITYYSALLTISKPLWILSSPWKSQTPSEFGSLHGLLPLSGIFSSLPPLANFCLSFKSWFKMSLPQVTSLPLYNNSHLAKTPQFTPPQTSILPFLAWITIVLESFVVCCCVQSPVPHLISLTWSCLSLSPKFNT